jgi:hypothetical protein
VLAPDRPAQALRLSGYHPVSIPLQLALKDLLDFVIDCERDWTHSLGLVRTTRSGAG